MEGSQAKLPTTPRSVSQVASSLTALHERKQQLKVELRAWERAYEDDNGGLVATHHDKKEDERYKVLKAQAKQVDTALELRRSQLRSAGEAGRDLPDGATSSIAKLQQALTVGRTRSATGSDWEKAGDWDAPGPDGGVFFEETASFSLVDALKLAVLCTVPYVAFLTAFSLAGAGARVFVFLTNTTAYYIPALSVGFGLLVGLYLLDSMRWRRAALVWLRRAGMAVAALAIVLGGLACTAEYPYAAIMLLFVLAPAYWYLLYKLGVAGSALPSFVLAHSAALCVMSSVSLLWWLIWVSLGNEWVPANKRRWMAAMPCDFCECSVADADAETEDSCTPASSTVCLRVLIFFLTPFVTSIAGFMAALLCFFLGQVDKQRGRISEAPRFFIMTLGLAVLSLWTAATIAGTSMQLSRVVLMGVLLMLIIVGLTLERFYGWKLILRKIMVKDPLARKLLRFCICSDWTKAIGLMVFAPLIVIGVCLSFCQQQIRKHTQVLGPADKARLVSKPVGEKLKGLASWNWTSVLRKVIVLGSAYLLVFVMGFQATVMTMSYFVQRVKGFSVLRSTLLFVAIGLCMFLLPPVPGAPVYLASGVLLTSVGLEAGWGFWAAAFYAIGVAFCIKLGACALQQKLIGESLGRSITVRKLVAINSTGMKVARIILRRRGLSLGKVAILVGFPDWPCSVGCGIMRLPLLPVLLGTTPVIMLVMPLSLAGSFLIKGCDQPYPSLCACAAPK
jgi:hypothetical protein